MMTRNNTAGFGAMLKRRREQLGLQQREVADLLGMAQPSYGAYELGDLKTTPPPTVLAKLTEIYGYSQTEMLTALGYEVGDLSISATRLADLLKETPPADYVRARFRINDASAVATSLELTARGQQVEEDRLHSGTLNGEAARSRS